MAVKKDDGFSLAEQNDAIANLSQRIISYSDKRMADLEKNKNDVLTEGECKTLSFMLRLVNELTININERINVKNSI